MAEAENADTKQSALGESPKKPSCIGFHVSPDMIIKFFQNNDSVQAKVSRVDGLVPVELPETSSEYNPTSLTTKVKQLLQNVHLRPIYLEKAPIKVCFQPIAPEQKTWKKEDNVLNLPSCSVWICRRNDTISCAYANTVTTWDWATDRSTLTSYKTTRITALAENLEGELVVGDKFGKLLISDQILDTGEKAAIRKITYVSSIICLLEFANAGKQLFDLRSKTLIPTPDGDAQKFVLLDNGMLARWGRKENQYLGI